VFGPFPQREVYRDFPPDAIDAARPPLSVVAGAFVQRPTADLAKPLIDFKFGEQPSDLP
jgi:hypothetical protein